MIEVGRVIAEVEHVVECELKGVEDTPLGRSFT